MREGTQDIIRGLDFARPLRPQVVGRLMPDDNDSVRDVIFALALLSQDWPEVRPAFASFIRAYVDLWAIELRSLDLVERFRFSLASIDALDIERPDMTKLNRLARAALKRKGVDYYDGAA